MRTLFRAFGVSVGVFLLALSTFGQAGQRLDRVQAVDGRAMGGQTVTTCAYNSASYTNGVYTATAIPCTPAITIYADINASVAITPPLLTNSQGNFSYWVTAGNYTECITGPNVTGVCYAVTIGAPGAGTNILPLSNNFTGTTNSFINLTATSTVSAGQYVSTSLASSGVSTVCATSGGVLFVGGSCISGNGTVIAGAQYALGIYPNAGSNTVIGPGTITTDSPGDLFVPASATFGGIEPFTDGTSYGMRATSGAIQTTGNCVGSNPIVSSSGAGSFIKGDGIALLGCGASTTFSPTTPAAPTVTPIIQSQAYTTLNNGAPCSTSFQYEVVARDAMQGISPASPATTITNGCTLGANTYTISTMSRSGAFVTVVTSGNNSATVGAYVTIYNSSNAIFDGVFPVTSVTNATTFVVGTGLDTNASATLATAATGGTLTLTLGNQVTLPTVTNATQFAIYRYNSGAAAYQFIGVSDPNFSVYNDFGGSQTRPLWFPLNAPSVGVADTLSTTVSASSGSSITLTNAPTQTLSGATIYQDNTPVMEAGLSAASNSTFRVPAAPAGYNYIFIAPLIDSTQREVQISGPMIHNDTIQIGAKENWRGMMGGSALNCPQFCWGPAQKITLYGNPGIQSGSNSKFDDLVLSQGGPNTVVHEVLPTGYQNGYNEDHVAYQLTGGNYQGVGLLLNGVYQVHTTSGLYLGNQGTMSGATPFPIIEQYNTGDTFLDAPFFVGQGIGIENPLVNQSNIILKITKAYAQGMQQPMVAIGAANTPHIELDGSLNDTSATPYIANLNGGAISCSSSSVVTIRNLANLFPEPNGGFPGLVSGCLVPGLIAEEVDGTLGQNRGAIHSQPASEISVVPYQASGTLNSAALDLSYKVMGLMHTASQYPWGFDVQPPAALAAVTNSGGSIPVGTYIYQTTAVDVNGNESIPSAGVSCTTTSGNQTCAITPGTLYTGTFTCNFYRNGRLAVGGNHQPCASAFTDSASGISGQAMPNESAAQITGSMNGRIWSPKFSVITPISGGASSNIDITATVTGGIGVPNLTDAGLASGSATLVCALTSGKLSISSCPAAGTGNVVAGANLTQYEPVGGSNGTANVAASGVELLGDLFSGATVDAQIGNANTAAITSGQTQDFRAFVGAKTLASNAQLVAGNTSNVAGEWILPCSGNWTDTLTANTETLFTVYPGSSVHGSCATNQFKITNSTTSTAKYGLAVIPGSSHGYFNIEGFSQVQTNNGATNAFTGANVLWSTADDGSTFRHFIAFDSNPNDPANFLVKPDATSSSLCCGAGPEYSQFNGNSTGPTPVDIEGVSTTNQWGLNWYADSIDQPKANSPNLLLHDHIGNNHMDNSFFGTYMEGNHSSSSTAAFVSIDGAKFTSFDGLKLESFQTSSTQTGVNITNQYASEVSVRALRMDGYSGLGSFTYPASGVVNANTSHTAYTDASGYLAEYETGPVYFEQANVLGTFTMGIPNYSAGAGSANVMTSTVAIQGQGAGTHVWILPNIANSSTTPTLNVNGLGAQTIVKCGASALVANDYITTAIAEFVSDGTHWQLLTPQNSCGSSGGGSAPGGSQYSMQYYQTSSTLGGTSAPSTNGVYDCGYTITGSAIAAPTCPQVGFGGRSITGSSSTDTTLYSDVNTTVVHDVAGSAAVTETLPTATTLANSNFAFRYCNHSSSLDNITPTTWTIQLGAATAGSSINIPPAACATVKVDPNNANTWDADCPQCTVNAFKTLTDAATVTWAIGGQLNANAALLFTVHSGSRTLNITNPVDGGNYVVIFTQDSTGGEGITLGSGCTWKVINGGGGAVTLSTSANAQDVLAFTYRASNTSCYANLGRNYD